jgi:hypothetical protein
MTTPAPETGQAEQTTPATGEPAETQPSAGQGQPEGQPAAPSGGQDLEYWKKRARDNEAKAKANADAAKRLQELDDAAKTDAQRIAEETARAQQERDEARAETLRYKAAATHRVSEANFDLLGTGTEEEITARAKRVGELEAAAAELKALKDAQQPQEPQGDGTGPVKKLTPGTPQAPDSTYPADWFPNIKKKKAPTQ